MFHSFTEDSIFRGKIRVFQPARATGYRFTVDSVLLGCFAAGKHVKVAVDLGAGSGVVGFILLHAGTARKVVFVELDNELVRACRLGVEANGFEKKASVIKADIRRGSWVKKIGKVSLIVCNPPYGKGGTGWKSPTEKVAAAKHEITLDVNDVMKSAAALLESSGRLCIVIPPRRLEEVFHSAAGLDLRIVRLRFVHSKPDRDVSNALVELKRDSGRATAVRILPPFITMDGESNYTKEAAELLDGKL